MISPLHALHSVILGLVEGITEFLPVSSTGHLILAADLLKFDIPATKLFLVVIQFGAILAVCWLYRVRLFDVVLNLNKRPEQMFAVKLLVAFLPAAVIGLTFNHVIEDKLFSPLIVATMLIVGAVAIWLVERFKPAPVVETIDDISLRRAFLIGCAQAVAVIPGTSRSGATIVGGLLCRVERKAATEFSFFLAIPTMFAATAFDMLKYAGHVSADDYLAIAIGFVVSFFSGLAAVKLFIAFVGRHGLVPFAVYRVILGALMLWYYIGRAA